MANLTGNEHHKTGEALLCANEHEPHHNISLAAFNILMSVCASLGNFLILVALHKESSLHPPSKLMFRYLAFADLCVGLITQPMFAAELLFEINGQLRLCNYFTVMISVSAVFFSGVSLITVTSVSVDRLLALSLGLRYRQVVTLRRVGAILICVWFGCLASSLLQEFWTFTVMSKVVSTVAILCLITSIYCYTEIFLKLRHYQVQIQDRVHQGQPNGGGIPLNIARYRKTVSAALWVQITLVACYLPEALLRPFGSLFSLSEISLILGVRYSASQCT